MATYNNPGKSSVKPQKQTGNLGNSEKRKAFTDAKSGGEREELARSIQRAVGDRAMPPEVNPKLENLRDRVKVGTQNKRGVKN